MISNVYSAALYLHLSLVSDLTESNKLLCIFHQGKKHKNLYSICAKIRVCSREFRCILLLMQIIGEVVRLVGIFVWHDGTRLLGEVEVLGQVQNHCSRV